MKYPSKSCMISLLLILSIMIPTICSSQSDTLRYSLIPDGIVRGERTALITPRAAHHEFHVGPNVFKSDVVLDTDGLPLNIEINGTTPDGIPWKENYRWNNGSAFWKTPLEHDSVIVKNTKLYIPIYKPYLNDLAVNALLESKHGKLSTFPNGNIWIEKVTSMELLKGQESIPLNLYAIHQLDISPIYIWTDDRQNIFADEVSILKGWEDKKKELDSISRDHLANYLTGISLASKISTDKTLPIVIRNAKIFDARNSEVTQPQTIIIENGRIVGISDEKNPTVPKSSKIIDAKGKMALPGLWDMHTHFHLDKCNQASALLFIARGITTVRDLGGESDLISFINDQVDQEKYAGPRILPALIMYGKGNNGMGVNVTTEEEGMAAIRAHKNKGYVQAKIYNSVPDSIVGAIASEAHRLNMRVSGHIPNSMTGPQAINAGFDEIQHLFYFRIGASKDIIMSPDIGKKMAEIDSDHHNFSDFIKLLKEHDVALDPTMAIVEESPGKFPFPWLEKMNYDLPPQILRNASYKKGPLFPPGFIAKDWPKITSKSSEILKAVYDEGIKLVTGTDATLGGFELARELELFVEAGIPEPHVLSMATYEAAKSMGMEKELGSIEVGKKADLILVDGDPTKSISEIRNINLVVKEGVIYNVDSILGGLGIVRRK